MTKEWIQHTLETLLTKLQGWLDGATSMAPNLVLALLVVLVAGYLSGVARRVTTRALDRFTDNDALTGLLGSVARVAVLIVGVFAALSLLHLERTVTSLLAGLGVVGLALGFAFQDIAANFMSGVFLAFGGPFETGDLIEVEDRIGRVTDIALRRTTLETLDGLTIIIPNKQVLQQTVINLTRTCDRRVDVEVGVAYGDDLDRTREVVVEALEGLEIRDPEREVEVDFVGFGASSIDFVARFWIEGPSQRRYLTARSRAIMAIKRAMDEAGLTIPFPIRTLELGASVEARAGSEAELSGLRRATGL